MKMRMSAWCALVVAASSAACSSVETTQAPPAPAETVTPPVDNTPATDSQDGGPVVDPGPDHGKVNEDTYPAFKPEVGQLVDNHGGILKNAEIVTVTWPNEKNADKFESFGDLIGQSQYWKDAVGEYGVGPAVSGPTKHVRIATAAPASLSKDDLDTLVATQAAAKNLAASKWPAPTEQTIYILYLPVGTLLDMGGGADACSIGVGGYHQSTQIDGKEIAYAIIPQCGKGDVDESTMSASHEIGEAATDPHPAAGAGWTGFDDNHLAWEFFQQGQTENGDMCEFYRDSFYKNTSADLPFAVQSLWSNKSSSAGHAPCLPVPPGVFFNVTPLEVGQVMLDLSSFGGNSKSKTTGFPIAVGATAQIPLGFYSEAATEAWTIKAVEGSPFATPSKTPKLELTLDKTTGQNGEKAYLTVKVLAAGKSKGELVTIVSSSGSSKHYMPLMIGSM